MRVLLLGAEAAAVGLLKGCVEKGRGMGAAASGSCWGSGREGGASSDAEAAREAAGGAAAAAAAPRGMDVGTAAWGRGAAAAWRREETLWLVKE